MKILLAGHVGYHWISAFCQEIKKVHPNWQIDVLGLNRPGIELDQNQEFTFFNVLQPYTHTKKGVRKTLFKRIFITSVVKHLLRNKNLFRFRTYRNLKKTLSYYARLIQKEEYYKNLFAPYDVINFHYIAEVSIQYTSSIPKNNKVMLTFWGSDLMQTSGVDLYAKQLKLIERADMAVMHSLEMREMFLAKYGRHHFPKTRINYFGLSDERFEKLKAIQADTSFIQNFRNKLGLEEGKSCILIGYSGSKRMQHEAIFDQIEKLNPEELEKIHLFIPMTYNNEDQEYFNRVKARIEKLPCSYHHFTNFMSDEEVIALYCLVEIFINLCETDAFNGTMIECLYLNKIGIIGAWLPYGMIRRKGVEYVELEKIEHLSANLSQLVSGDTVFETAQNSEKIYELASNTYTIPYWCDLYEKITTHE
jgi:hypothetical protein